MVTWIVVGVLVMAVVGGLLTIFSNDSEIPMYIGFIMGIVVGLFVTLGISSCVSYVPVLKTQPIISIYMNQSEDEIYLKAISGSQLIYWIDEDGLPREHTVSVSRVEEVKIESVSPYLEITSYLFKKEWYKYFAFSTKGDEYVFHVPATGLEADINDLLK